MASPARGRASASVFRTFARLIARFRPAVRAQLWLLAGALGLVLLAVGFRLAEPWPLKFVFDGLLGAESGPAMLAALDPDTRLGLLVGAFIAIVMAHAGLTFLSKLAMALALRRILARMRAAVFDHMLRMSVLRHQHHASGDLANRLTVDIDRLRLAGTNNAINLAVNLLTMAGMLVVMLWLNWQLALIALAALPAFHLLTARMMALILEQSRRFRASDGALAGEAVHAAGAAQAIQGLSLYATIAGIFGRGSERNLALGMRSAILKTVLRQSVTVLFAVCIGLLVWRGAVLVEAGSITPGDLIIFMAYLREGMEKPMIRFSANLAELGRGAASGERLLTLLDEPAEPEAQPAAAVPPRRGVIRFEGVSFGYPGGPLVLDGASFSLAPGEQVAIVGPSGGGKSTVIALLLRLVEPAGGRITIDGVDIAAMGRAELRASLAVVFQDTALFDMTVRENLTLGRDAGEGEIAEALRLAGAEGFVAALEGGLDHRLPPGGRSLSGGQRQRLGIARALLRRAPVLLLDEPTSALDPEGRAALEQRLFGAPGAGSVLLITHQTDGLAGFDRVYRLGGGVLRPVQVTRSVA